MTKYAGIIIFGPMGSGKDTLAELIDAELSRRCVTVKLGEHIRNIVDDVAENDLYVQGFKRQCYQSFGQGARESLGEHVWDYVALSAIDRIIRIEGNTIPIIPDGRQFPELEFWKEHGFLTVGINAPESMRKARLEERDGYVPDDKAFHHVNELQAAYIAENLCEYRRGNVDSLSRLGVYAKEIAIIFNE
jgi:dephospho-CoA kinase